MRELTFSPMVLADVDQVEAIERATFAIPWSRASLEREVNENVCARYLVARSGAEILGYAGMWFVLDEAHVTNVAVHADVRGEGIGEALMRALIRLAADSGMVWMTLECRRSNKVAQNLYHKLGFIDVGYRKRYYEDNREDALVMALEELGETGSDAGGDGE